MSVSIPSGSPDLHSHAARWSVGFSVAFGVALLAAIGTYAAGYAFGGQSAVEDNWVAWLVTVLAIGGLFASLAAFVLAIAAKVRGEHWALLWLPVVAFPLSLTLLVLAEVFWLE